MVCTKCQRQMVDTEPVVISDGKVFCRQCATGFNTCAMCVNAMTCEFEQNTDPLPKMVVQNIQRGNMTMQASVPNPERLEKFCKPCKCHFDGGCMKQNGVCQNYQEIEF